VVELYNKGSLTKKEEAKKRRGKDHKNDGLTLSVQMNLGFSECEKKKKRAKEKELSREKQQHISSV